MADDNVLFAVIHSHEGRFDSGNLSGTPKIFPKGIRLQLDFWLRNRNNTIGYRPEISDLNRFNEALV